MLMALNTASLARSVSHRAVPMPHRQLSPNSPYHPWRTFSTVLITVFTIEISVMLVLPWFFKPGEYVLLSAVLDASVLTVVMSPILLKMAVRPLQQLAEQRQTLVAKTLKVQEDERRRIARDLHDELGQSMTSLLVGLRAIEKTSTEPSVQELARELLVNGNETHEEVRRLARGLRPSVLDDVGLIPAVERLVADLLALQDIDARVEVCCVNPERLASDVETALYRIIQEACTNAIRHGKATAIHIRMSCSPENVELLITDNGQGFDPESVLSEGSDSDPFGLLSMRERTWLLHGDFDVESNPGEGTRVRIQIPITTSSPGK